MTNKSWQRLLGKGARMGKRSRAVEARRGKIQPVASVGCAVRPPEAMSPEQLRPVLRHAAGVLRAARRRQARAEVDERAAVAQLRALGLSWHEVGALVQMTAEGARKRYR